jgi:hypothetical protein
MITDSGDYLRIEGTTSLTDTERSSVQKLRCYYYDRETEKSKTSVRPDGVADAYRSTRCGSEPIAGQRNSSLGLHWQNLIKKLPAGRHHALPQARLLPLSP